MIKCPFFLHFQVECGRFLGSKDLTLSKMKSDGFKSVFVGIGNPEPKKIPIFEPLTEANGFYTSKDFLPQVILMLFNLRRVS